MQAIAAQVDGYDAADLRVLLDRAALAAARRDLAAASHGRHALQQSPAYIGHAGRALSVPVKSGDAATIEANGVLSAVPAKHSSRLRIMGDDLSTALQGFTPSAYWGVGKLSGGGSGVQASAPLVVLVGGTASSSLGPPTSPNHASRRTFTLLYFSSSTLCANLVTRQGDGLNHPQTAELCG